MKINAHFYKYRQLNWYSGANRFSSVEYIQPVPTCQHRNGTTMLNTLMCLCVTGQPETVNSTSGRIVNYTSYMTSLVLMVAYSAFLFAILAVQRQVLPFRNLQGLLDDASYKLRVVRNSPTFNIFYVRRKCYCI
jgi:hypothetical protein